MLYVNDISRFEEVRLCDVDCMYIVHAAGSLCADDRQTTYFNIL